MIAVVFCLARDEVRAVRILDELRAAGFREDKISVLLPESAIAGGLNAEPATNRGERSGVHDQSPQPTMLSLPKIGRLIGTGPLTLVLNQEIIGNPRENFASRLADVGLPRERIEHYLENLAAGKALLAANVCCLDDATRLETVFKNAGAEDVLVRAEASSEDPGCGVGHFRHAA